MSPDVALRGAPALARLRSLALPLLPLLLAGCVSLTPYDTVRRMLPPESLLTVDGHRVHLVDRGAGETVVLLHGFGASTYSWRRVVDGLSGYRTVALDLHGFGYTERPPGVAPYTRRGQVELVRGVLDRLGVGRVHLVGHSYGGAVALAFAHRYPERLRSLVLVAAARPDYPAARRRCLARLRPLTALYLRTWALRRSPVRRALERSVVDDTLVTPELVDAYRERLTVEGVVRGYRGLTVPAGAPEPVALEAIEVPVLAVWGAEDPLIPAPAGRVAVERLPCHRFVTLPGTGHLPMEEDPRGVVTALEAFLREPEAVCAGGREGRLG